MQKWPKRALETILPELNEEMPARHRRGSGKDIRCGFVHSLAHLEAFLRIRHLSFRQTDQRDVVDAPQDHSSGYAWRLISDRSHAYRLSMYADKRRFVAFRTRSVGLADEATPVYLEYRKGQ